MKKKRLPIDPRSPKSFWDDQHRRLGEEPITWVNSADPLLYAFDLVSKEAEIYIEDRDPKKIGLFKVATMLGSVAIENLLKGIIVQKKQEKREPLFDKKGKFCIDTHNLLELSEIAEVDLTPEENILLEKLEQFIRWAGRYPIPLRSEEMRSRTLSENSFAPRTYGPTGADFPSIREFIAKLKPQLPTIRG